jgi:hypothetical protein
MCLFDVYRMRMAFARIEKEGILSPRSFVRAVWVFQTVDVLEQVLLWEKEEGSPC